MTGHVVIAPDKFRGSLTSPEVAAHVAAGLRLPGSGDVPVVELPVADGGDGTVDAVVASGFTRVETEVTGPAGDPVTASYAVRDEPGARVAVIELAEASGLRRLPGGPVPLTATSRGTGELIAHAVRHGATRIVLGLGGSACTDGGAGMAQALGVRLLDAHGADLPPGGAALRDLHTIDASGLLRGFEVVVASDVDNPLLGPYGAAAVYGPQKGASPQDVAVLEAGLARLAAVAAHTHGLAGAAEHDGVVRAMGVAGPTPSPTPTASRGHCAPCWSRRNGVTRWHRRGSPDRASSPGGTRRKPICSPTNGRPKPRTWCSGRQQGLDEGANGREGGVQRRVDHQVVSRWPAYRSRASLASASSTYRQAAASSWRAFSMPPTSIPVTSTPARFARTSLSASRAWNNASIASAISCDDIGTNAFQLSIADVQMWMNCCQARDSVSRSSCTAPQLLHLPGVSRSLPTVSSSS
ncbi:glycerate kinase [Microbispora sp. GKU 823]|uniref:glycerate kinase n=1 Tax=Microbispora sp. GKU 823 TaxID=1652100 RepID=UPI0009A3DD82|nr:glycerate kinase [Microbispora sp. GKU 823]